MYLEIQIIIALVLHASSHRPKNAGRRGGPALNYPRLAPVAQGIEQRFPKPRVGGSNPSRRTPKLPANRGNEETLRRKIERFYTNPYTNAALSKRVVHRTSGNVAHVGQNVGVGVKGEADISMP